MTTATRLYLNRAQAAEACSVSVDMIDNAVRDGRLVAKKHKAKNGKTLFRPADLIAWVESWEDA